MLVDAILNKGQDVPEYRLRSTGHTLQGESLIRKAAFSEAIQWTKAVRVYENVSLRAYAKYMGRWMGYRIKNLNCIPAEKRITKTGCYRRSTADMITSIWEVGVQVFVSKGILIFSPDSDIYKSPMPVYLRNISSGRQ